MMAYSDSWVVVLNNKTPRLGEGQHSWLDVFFCIMDAFFVLWGHSVDIGELC